MKTKKHVLIQINILQYISSVLRVLIIISVLTPLVFLTDCQTKKTTSSVVAVPAFRSWAPTPPMGWNSWDCYGPTVVESEVKANADYMAEHLNQFGWQYVVVDIRWYVENDKAGGYNEDNPILAFDEYGRLTPALNRFPSAANGNGFKPLGDYIHGKGLKFGIHMMRGIPVLAVKKNTPILGSTARAQDIYSTENQCVWLKDMFTIVVGKPGAQEYYNSIFQLYASWGLDFIKVDDLSGRTAEIEMVRKAIDNCGRPIVISISPGGDRPETADFLKNNVNMWRTSNDFWDNWPALKNQFGILNSWAGLGVKGCYPDGDMLPLGKIGLRAERGVPRMTGFTKDEQYSLMSLFAIFGSPLMFGGDLPGIDEFTLGLITNKAVLEVNQHSINRKQLFRENDFIAWKADDPKTGDKFVSLFNASDQQPVVESKAIWKSELITQETPGQSVDIDLDIAGARKLFLVATYDDLLGYGKHNCDWIEPVLIRKDGKLRLTDQKWVKASAGRGEPVVNKTAGGGKLTVNGKEYINGISTVASSIIEYDLPEGCTRFKTKAGIDKDALMQLGQIGSRASARFLIFVEDPAGPMPADTASVSVKFEQLGMTGTHSVTDLWSGKKLGQFTDGFTRAINRHGAGLYRIH